MLTENEIESTYRIRYTLQENNPLFYSSACINEDRGGVNWWIFEHKMTYFSSNFVFLFANNNSDGN